METTDNFVLPINMTTTNNSAIAIDMTFVMDNANSASANEVPLHENDSFILDRNCETRTLEETF